MTHPPWRWAGSSGIGFDSQSVVHGNPELPLASKVSLRYLDGDVSEQELDLIQFVAREVAETAQVRRSSCGASLSIPARAAAERTTTHGTFGECHPQTRPALLIARNTGLCVMAAATGHASTVLFTQVGNGDGAHVSALADQIGNHAVLVALLDRLEAQGQQLGSGQAAADQHRDHRVIPQLARGRGHRALEEPAALLSRQPVSEANTNPAHPLHATNTGCQFRTQEAGVGRLVRDAPDGSKPKVDRGRRVSPLFKVNPVRGVTSPPNTTTATTRAD